MAIPPPRARFVVDPDQPARLRIVDPLRDQLQIPLLLLSVNPYPPPSPVSHRNLQTALVLQRQWNPPVRGQRGNTPRSRHLCFLARCPSRQAIQRARHRVREITDRSRLLVPVEDIVQDVNRFLRGWSGYFRYGNSARQLNKINHYAMDRLARFVGKRHKRGWGDGRRSLPTSRTTGSG